ncbi:hypothetical protein B0T13DRAFT_484113 [Neurospora crassa]|nr:hypothetical protein B0T13DRAFT_484113 [Neurospora crassa]
MSPAATAIDGVLGRHRRGPSAFGGIPKPKIPLPSKLPRKLPVTVNDGTAEEKGGEVSTATSTSSRVDDFVGQFLGLRVPLRKGRENTGVEGKRRQSPDSIYSQDMEGSEGKESIFAKTYHGFMFGEHGDGEERSQGCVDGSEKKGEDRRWKWEPPRLWSPNTSGPPLGSHYRRRNPIVPPIEPGDRLEGWGRGEREPTSPTPFRAGTTTRILRKPARLNLRPPSTQQVLRTPSPLSATLKRPGPHVPHGGRLGLIPTPTSTDDVSAGGAGHTAPMFARELTASAEVLSSVAAVEDDRRGMVSRWSTDSSDISDSSDSSDEEVMNWEGLSVSRGPTRKACEKIGPESVEGPAEGLPKGILGKHETQKPSEGPIRETLWAKDQPVGQGPNATTDTKPYPGSQENDLPFQNFTTKLTNLQASLNQLISQATSIEIAFGQVREAMIDLRQKATETLVDVEQFVEKIRRTEEELAEVRRPVKGKAKDFVGNGEDHQEQARKEEENSRHQEGNDDHKGHEKEQYMERESKKEGQQRPEEPREGPPKGRSKPQTGPPSGPAPGGAEWV